MQASWNSFWTKAALLIAALLVVPALFLTPVFAAAKTITNTAQARWSHGDEILTTDSNIVSFEVISDDAKISVLPLPRGGASWMIDSGHCGNAALPGVRIGEADTDPTSPSTISAITIGQPVVFRLVLSGAALDGSKIDTVSVVISSASGDRETVTVTETTASSGVFFGAVPTSAIPPQPTQGDCRLSVADGDKVTVEYNGTTGGGSAIKADVNVLADPYWSCF